jgi:ubiquitin-protein ligase
LIYLSYQINSLKTTSIPFFQGISAVPTDDDMRVWNALIDGPADTCYEDGSFTLRLEFSGMI